MFRLEKTFRFEASHQLPKHDGKCQRLHGHSWVGKIVVESMNDGQLQKDGPEAGMLIDYGKISDVVKPFVEQYLDHWHLNETTGLENPTSEELARWVYNKLKLALPMLAAVVIEETCTSSCEYRP